MKNQQLWDTLLLLKRKISNFSEVISFCYCSEAIVLINSIPEELSTNGFFIVLDDTSDFPDKVPVLKLHNFLKIDIQNGATLAEDKLYFLKIYLPYCFLNYQAQQYKRCIAIAHFAQSLDGKIATDKGDSRWIGNAENLDHAHRMRALCDGILVGNNTVRNDRPQLTVRRVAGENPKRIVLGASAVDLSSLMACCSDPILMVSSKADYPAEQVEHLNITTSNCRINSLDLLKLLFEKGIYSVYIEGGAMTTSNFLSDQAVDILQLHISPLIFGSGKQGVVLPQIHEVTDSQRFSDFDFIRLVILLCLWDGYN